MKKVVLSLSLVLLGSSAMAQNLLSSKDVTEITQSMVEAYKAGKSNGMRSAEQECWKEMKGTKEGLEGVVVACGVSSLAGHLIDDLSAQKEKRKINSYWTDDAVAERVAENAAKTSLKEKAIERLMDKEIFSDRNSEIIAKVLTKAGF